MSSIPGGAAAAIARGVGAYLRATKPEELPGRLRRFRGFTNKGLMSHKEELVAALDDPEFRSAVASWLGDSHPRLGKGDAGVLRRACAGQEKWESDEDAPARSQTIPSAARSTPVHEGRDKDKVKKAREELRRAREELDAAKRGLQARIGALEADVSAATARAKEAEGLLAETRKQLARAERDLERATRRARTGEAKLKAQIDGLKRELAEARRALEAHRTATVEAPAARRRRATPGRADGAPPRPSGTRGRRRRLRAPIGRLRDDPETLDEWLHEMDVRLLVDGYNVTKTEGGFGRLPLADQRKRLIDSLGRLARKYERRILTPRRNRR